ncbi:MAG: cob(I)yrinic acid a,c-diamide adenosyltransferase [Candidatus Aenigmarchaeota archaeon]|nr:cob(I)yrinic acid a,c-diamide adenosyltransferase [Candidatus Aenigmarchaeota archaeon]
MKKYSDHFDSGHTYLYAGECVKKDNPLVEAFGEVDELNSLIGLAVSLIKDKEAREILREIQGDLLLIGSDLANPIKKQETLDPRQTERLKRTKEMTENEVKKMEDLIMKFEKELPPLNKFILPSGTPGATALQYARAVTRRVERRVVAAKMETVNFQILKYFNRLSDFLFILARIVNNREKGKEVVWE